MADGITGALNGNTLQTAVSTASAVFSDVSADGYSAGYSFMESLASGIEAGLSLVEAAIATVADLFPHSPAKAGPLKKAPNWDAYLNMGLTDAASRVAQVLGGVGGGGLSVAPVAASGGSSVTPVRSGGGRYGSTVIQFTYAPTVSLASQREAQEVIAPMLAEVLRREARRG